MNGYNRFSQNPSLNGLKRSDGSTNVTIIGDLTGRVNMITNDPTSFFYTTQGEDDLILNTPFTTIQQPGTDTLSTNLNFHANKISSTEPIDVPLNLVAGQGISITNNNNQYTISNTGGGGSGGNYGTWQYEQEQSTGHLLLKKDNQLKFRYIHSPLAIFARQSVYSIIQNGQYSLFKSQ
jgi:hypothetical protein